MATSRKTDFHTAAIFMAMASDVNLKPQEVIQEIEKCPSLTFAVVSAEYHRRHNNFDKVVKFLQCVIKANIVEELKNPIVIPTWVDLKPDGSIVLHGNSPIWQIRRDVKVQAYLTRNDGGSGIFAFDRHSTERNRAALSWNHPLSVPYHHQLLFNVKVAEGCSLLIETVINDAFVRHPIQPDMDRIYHGTGNWETLMITVEGTDLRFIYIILDLDADNYPMLPGCTMELKSVIFALDAQ